MTETASGAPKTGVPGRESAQTSFESSADTTGPPGLVWAQYVDVSRWPEWNAAVERVELDGPFAAGATGSITPPGAGPLPFRITEATPGESYTSETDIADTVSLHSTSRLTALPGGGTRITQRSELVGPAAPYFAASFGPALSTGVPRTVSELAARVSGQVAAQ